jgi:transcriptional/translational regulatory protein YebC/TACO1
MDCLTDNKQRAANDIWTVVKKLNGKVETSQTLLDQMLFVES